MPALNILMRFLHIISAVTLVGGVLAWRFATIPALSSLTPEGRRPVDETIASMWRRGILFSPIGLLVSGVYNFLRWRSAGLPPEYQAVIGVKFLLVLHVFAVAVLIGRPDNLK